MQYYEGEVWNVFITQLISTKILTTDAPYFTHEGEVRGVFCMFKVQLIYLFYCKIWCNMR